MKKNLLTLFCALMALSATAQLAVPFDYTESNFKDVTVTVQKGTKGTISWSGGVKHAQGGFNWDDSYIVIAIDGLPDKLTFSTSTSTLATPKNAGDYWYVCQSTSTSFNDKLWKSNKQTNSPSISLAQDTKYLKLCYSGNLEGNMKNIKVTKYTPEATAAVDVTTNSFAATWKAAKGDNITYILEVSDANGVIKTVDNLTGTSYTVEDLTPLTAYSYVVYVVANGTTTSDVSNTIEVTTLPTPTTALDATDVTFNSFTANWEASEFEGAKYDIEVKDDEYTTIAYVTVIGSTFYTITGLDPESTYSYVVYVSVDDVTSDASNVIEVTTLAKPAITPDQYEYTLISDTGIEDYTSIIITAVNVTEATATVTGDAEFYFKDADGNHVTTKTFAVEPEGPTEIELYSMFTEGGDFSATVTFSATDADDVTVSVTATATFVVPATKALNATDVTFNSFTANWVASNLEGATYTIEVRNEDYDLIASASGLEETSYAVSNLDPESYYSYVVFVSVGEVTSDASNVMEVKTLEKPVITPDQDEYQLLSDTDIEGLTSIIITAVNVTEATATVTGDAEFYFKDVDGNPVTTKTFAVEPEGPTEIELFSYFTADGDYSATITFSATDADDAVVTVLANVSKPTDVPEQKLSSIVKSFNNGLLELDKDYASIVVSNLAGKTVAEGKGHTIAVEQGQILMIEIIDFEGNKSTVKVQ